MTEITQHKKELSLRRIFNTWWPLAASWALMSAELPALSAVVARLENPEINLAAYGGVVFPLALIIEAPIIMLLAASTALSKDIASYRLVRRFMMITSACLTAIHILIAFTPLYYLVVEGLLGAPQEIVEPARIGLMIMTPWTWTIAYRRFNQGVLIRFGHSQTITIGTVIRLSADLLVLTVGYLIGSIPGIVVATSAVAAGVFSEAAYSGIIVQPVVKNELSRAPVVKPALTWRAFYDFYIPLAMTSLLFLLAMPIGSAAMSRMPDDIPSLAVWPVVGGFLFILRSLGVAYNEVVVALLDVPYSYFNLRRFTHILAIVTTLLLAILAATPLSNLWFRNAMGLSDELTSLSRAAFWLALPIPALNVFQSWYQGAIVVGRKTRGVTEATFIYLITSGFVLVIGVRWGNISGIYVAIAALGLSMTAQTAWLWFRSRPVMLQVQQRDALEIPIPTAQAGTG
ncbi:MAG: hypothetical protein U9R58_11340 [Chloroflexota bacterium]|nr:hypothetical protein [Chloroflexota bacterium]